MRIPKKMMSCIVWIGCVLFAAAGGGERSVYDPLAIVELSAMDVIDLDVHDAARKRDIPIKVYLPSGKGPAPVILFSHGLGGSREGSAYLGKHWAARGYVAVFLQHPGSDSSVWKDQPGAKRMSAMNAAANGENFMLRVKDVPAVLDQLEQWNAREGHSLAGRLDLETVGMSGHSFGAVTTQAVSGQTFTRGRALLTDARIDAAVVMSPSCPKAGSASGAFGKVTMPWLLMTGTKDVSMIGETDLQSRLAVFPALPAGSKYELVLFNAEHSAFTERGLPGDSEARNPNHHRAILALSTAFWDSYLRDDAAAKEWLNGEGAKSILETKDTWKMK
jgi:predicted dienelactone hydrolase